MNIWIDLDNTPHVPFFKPIVRELERRGFNVVLTARDAFQVCDLARKLGLPAKAIGRHYGKNSVMKVLGLIWRSVQLLPVVLRSKPQLAVSHGSRAQILLCNLLRIPTVMIMDYEHAQTPWLLRPRWEIVPDVLLNESLQCKDKERIRTYHGIKEDVYAPEFRPDASLAQELGLNTSAIVATVRPPATEAHYHNPESELLFNSFMERAVLAENLQVVLLPRNKSQEAQIRASSPQWFTNGKVIVPQRAVDGLNLLWHSDLVVSGGGTMNREAAALGIPVYSIFRGKMGAVDRELEKQGRLLMVRGVEEVAPKIAVVRRDKNASKASKSASALAEVVTHIEQIAELECAASFRIAAAAKVTNA
jgi:predicted glycosyltransferase